MKKLTLLTMALSLSAFCAFGCENGDKDNDNACEASKCTVVDNASSMACEADACVVSACKAGYKVSSDKKSCEKDDAAEICEASKCFVADHASAMACEDNACVVSACESGYKVSDNKKACIEDTPFDTCTVDACEANMPEHVLHMICEENSCVVSTCDDSNYEISEDKKSCVKVEAKDDVCKDKVSSDFCDGDAIVSCDANGVKDATKSMACSGDTPKCYEASGYANCVECIDNADCADGVCDNHACVAGSVSEVCSGITDAVHKCSDATHLVICKNGQIEEGSAQDCSSDEYGHICIDFDGASQCGCESDTDCPDSKKCSSEYKMCLTAN